MGTLTQRAYMNKARNKQDSLNRVAKGEGSAGDKFSAIMGMSLWNMRRGVKAGAAKKAKKIGEHVDRIAKGEAGVRDVMKMYGNISMNDVVAYHFLEVSHGYHIKNNQPINSN
jgi:hypothetical protein